MRKKIIETINQLPDDKLIKVDALVKEILLETTAPAPKLSIQKSIFKKIKLKEIF